MVFLLIPLAVVGYRVLYEQRRLEREKKVEEEESLPDDAQLASSCSSSESTDDHQPVLVEQIVSRVGEIAERFRLGHGHDREVMHAGKPQPEQNILALKAISQ